MRGKLLVISGLSGAGKGTVAAELAKRFDNYALSISATTRDRRPGEVDGVNYYFLTKDEFEKKIEMGELLEYAKYVDNYYGTPKDFVLKKLESGINVILEIEMQGALQIKKLMPSDAVLVFYTLKDAETQKERLINRGREGIDEIKKRMAQAVIDASYAKDYDYVIVNDELSKTIDDTVSVINGSFDKDHKIKNENLKILDNLVNEIKENKNE